MFMSILNIKFFGCKLFISINVGLHRFLSSRMGQSNKHRHWSLVVVNDM